MYYRVAIQVGPSLTWQWKSTALSELSALFQFLRLYAALPHDRLRVFSSTSREEMNEQLVRENQGFRSTSVTAAQFLQERMIGSPEMAGEVGARGPSGNERTTSIALATEPSPNQSSQGVNALNGKGVSPLDKRREELERGVGGDHDLPYSFALPPSMPQVLAWMRLLAKIQRGELQP
jgi:hypothetical protein